MNKGYRKRKPSVCAPVARKAIKKKGICKTMTEKWRKDVKSVEKFFVLVRNREDLFFGDNI